MSTSNTWILYATTTAMIPYNNEHNRSATSEDSIQPKTSSIATQKFAENATTIPSGTMQPPSSSKLNIISNLSNQRSSTHQQVHTSPSNKDDKREASKPNPSTKPYVDFLSKLGVHILLRNNRSNSVNLNIPWVNRRQLNMENSYIQYGNIKCTTFTVQIHQKSAWKIGQKCIFTRLNTFIIISSWIRIKHTILSNPRMLQHIIKHQRTSGNFFSAEIWNWLTIVNRTNYLFIDPGNRNKKLNIAYISCNNIPTDYLTKLTTNMKNLEFSNTGQAL